MKWNSYNRRLAPFVSVDLQNRIEDEEPNMEEISDDENLLMGLLEKLPVREQSSLLKVTRRSLVKNCE